MRPIITAFIVLGSGAVGGDIEGAWVGGGCLWAGGGGGGGRFVTRAK